MFKGNKRKVCVCSVKKRSKVEIEERHTAHGQSTKVLGDATTNHLPNYHTTTVPPTHHQNKTQHALDTTHLPVQRACLLPLGTLL